MAEYKLSYTGQEIDEKLKQIDNLSTYVTPQMFGAVGGGEMSLFENAKIITFAGKAVSKLELNEIVLWQAVTYKNWVRYSTESDGVAIYNGGLGYKDGYRIRSSGAEGQTDVGSHTGFIPAKGGDILRFSGYSAFINNTANAVNMYDSSYANIGQATPTYPNPGYGNMSSYPTYGWEYAVEEFPGVYRWKLPPDARIAFIRVSGYTLGDGSKMIVTVNEEII